MMRPVGVLAGMLLLAALLLVHCPAHAAGYNESCSAGNQCDGGLTCQPGVQKCYSSPRQFLEPCVAGYECAEGLSCQPGVHVCYHDPREESEACSAGYGCAGGLECASGDQVCRDPRTRGAGAFCDATRTCGEGLFCHYESIGVPVAGTGLCFPKQQADTLIRKYRYLSDEDSEEDGPGTGKYYNGVGDCGDNQILIGLNLRTHFFNFIKHASRGDKYNWRIITGIGVVCVDTDPVLNWKSSPPVFPNYIEPAYPEGPADIALVCPVNSYVTHISGSYGGALLSSWNEDDFAYSVQIQCSDGSTSKSYGGFPIRGNPASIYDVTCPKNTTANGIWSATGDFPIDEDVTVSSSGSLPTGSFAESTGDYTPGAETKRWVSRLYFSFTRDIALQCMTTSKLADAAQAALDKKRTEPTPAPEPGPKGGGTRLGTLPGERACNTYMNERRIPQEGNRKITESERLELCGQAKDETEAAARIQCFADSILGGVEAYTATFNCRYGKGPPPKGTPSWPPPEPALWQVETPPREVEPAPRGEEPPAGPAPEAPPPREAEPAPPAERVNEEQRCMGMLEGNVPWNQAGDTHWEEESKPQLCAGATDADERIACFTAKIDAGVNWVQAAQVCRDGAPVIEPLPADPAPPELEPEPVVPPPAGEACDASLEETCKSYLQDQVPWTLEHADDLAYRHWDEENMLELCRCTTDPGATVQCFQDRLYNNGHPIPWQDAIAACKAS